jgi:hypothetical protein
MEAKATKVEMANAHVTSVLSEKITEALLPIMQFYGISKIETRTASAGGFTRTLSTIDLFPGVPQELANAALFVKDGLAEILASCGVVGLTITASDDEKAKMQDWYVDLIGRFNAAKGQLTTADSTDSTDTTTTGNKKCKRGSCKCQAKKDKKAKKAKKASEKESLKVEPPAQEQATQETQEQK